MARNQCYSDWLENAHFREKQPALMLASLAARIDNYPEFKERKTAHLSAPKTPLKYIIHQRAILHSVMKDVLRKIVIPGYAAGKIFNSAENIPAGNKDYLFDAVDKTDARLLISAVEQCDDLIAFTARRGSPRQEKRMVC